MTHTSQTYHQSKYIIGIDLGTTNIAVSYVDTEKNKTVQHFPIPQLVSTGEVTPLSLLPSFCYLPGKHELPKGALELPWNKKSSHAVGEFAREQGSAVPGRLVSSAKSWLAHNGVDRTANILPWGGDLAHQSISPITASQYYLEHIKEAWNAKFKKIKDQHGSPAILSEQQIILTVPASFDEAARELTVQAARKAGFKHLILLEEPLAAFYDWLRHNEKEWKQLLKENTTVLVIDVGGGTSDFSLIQIEKNFTLRRIAVGDHLLLGGDNIDITLAKQCEASWNTTLPTREWSMLCQQCRHAKEQLLTPNTPESIKITISGNSSSIISNTRSITITKQQIQQILNDGFFPKIEHDSPKPTRKTGIREMGLPYVADPAITKHLLAFLKNSSSQPKQPNYILYNGGALLPKQLRNRINKIITSWSQEPYTARELQAQDLNLAVSRGATYYGLVRRGQGVRVKGGIARSYYLEVHNNQDQTQLICIMPRDTNEGEKIILKQNFQLAANQPVQFPLYASSTRLNDQAGSIITDRNELTQLPPLKTVLTHGKKTDTKLLNVHLEIILNEVGTLDLFCVTHDKQHRFPLSFNLRNEINNTTIPETIISQEKIQQIKIIIKQNFATPNQLPQIMKQLENTMQTPRKEWGINMLREIADLLLQNQNWRQISPEHEIRWLNLLGFTLRPGCGTVADAWRIQQLWKLWYTKTIHQKNNLVNTEWWILWRRVVAGLQVGHQQQIASQLIRELIQKNNPSLTPKKISPQIATEMWRTIGALEKIPTQTKLKCLKKLLTPNCKHKPHHFWTIARLTARQLLYGPNNAIIPAKNIEQLMPQLIQICEKANIRQAYLAISSSARLCGIRELDLNEEIRKNADAMLERCQAPHEWRTPLFTQQTNSKEYQQEIAGDSLPVGLKILHPNPL